MSIRCGIDLGTTYSSIAWYDPEKRLVQTVDLEHADGKKTIPSVIYCETGGAVVVGEAARGAEAQHPDRVFRNIKRSTDDDLKTKLVDGKTYTLQEIWAEVLKVLKADAEWYLGQPVTEAVIAVPAGFSKQQRLVVENAASLAELKVLELIPEPQAAALALVVNRIKEIEDCNLLVYDLGGGTFDIALMVTEREDLGLGLPSLRTILLDHAENQQLGGLEWDRTLARLVADKAMNEYDFEDPHLGARNKAILLEYCETAKRQLCRGNSSFFYTGLHGHQVEILPGEFQSAICDLVSRTGELLEKMLRQAEQSYGWLTAKRIQALTAQGVPRAKLEDKKVQLLLCGGLARMPMIRDRVGQVIGELPLVDRTPELLVTMGAAYRAYLKGLDAHEKLPSVELILPQLTALHVINMYRKLGLPVTNDGQLIEAEVKKRWDFYLRMTNSTDPKLREEANRWFKDVSLLQNNRPLLLAIVRDAFFSVAKAMLHPWLSDNEKVPRPFFNRLIETAQSLFICDLVLAREFADSAVNEMGIQVVGPTETIRKDYEPIRIQRFCEQRFDDAELRKFCLYLKQKLRRVYDYSKLAGATLADKIISLIELAERNSEIGELVYYLCWYWIEEGYRPFVLAEEGFLEELAIFRKKLRLQGKQEDAEKVLRLQERILSDSGLDSLDAIPSAVVRPILDRLDRLEQQVSDGWAMAKEVANLHLFKGSALMRAERRELVFKLDFSVKPASQPILARLNGVEPVMAKMGGITRLAEAVLLADQVLQSEAQGEDVIEAIDHLVGKLLLLYDQAEQMSLAAKPESVSARNYRAVQDQVVQTLRAAGIYPIPETRRFNPEIHEVAETTACQTPDKDGEIVQTLRTGFRTEEAIVRQAEVIVRRYQPPD